MARSILISFAGYPPVISSFFPDNGLASLAGTLVSNGHDTLILDYNTFSTFALYIPEFLQKKLALFAEKIHSGLTECDLTELQRISAQTESFVPKVHHEIIENIIKNVKKFKPDFIGFKLWSGEGLIASFKAAEKLKKLFPKLKIFGGGPAVEYTGRFLFEMTNAFDGFVENEGELAILEIAEYIEGKQKINNIPNLILQGNPETDIDRQNVFIENLGTIPLPNYTPEIYPSLKSDTEKIKTFVIDETRGCPIGCAFCINRQIMGSKSRSKPVKRVLEEVEQLIKMYDMNLFRFGGTYSPPEDLKKLAKTIIEKKLNLTFSAFTSVRDINIETLRILKEAGCYGLFYGIESGDGTILNSSMEKQIGVDKIRQVIKDSIDTDLYTAASFIFPAPFETVESALNTKKLILEFFPDQKKAAIITQFPVLIPKTTWWKNRKRFGIELMGSEASYRKQLATYKIKHILPPTFWEILPYKINGIDQAELANRNRLFQRELLEHKIILNFTDDLAMLGYKVGIDPSEFRRLHFEIFFTGNQNLLEKIIINLNLGNR